MCITVVLPCTTLVQDIGFEEYIEARGVVIVEWADKFPELLPSGRLDVCLRIVDLDRRCVQWMAYDMLYSRYFLHGD
jgi:tRNA A37 threonylcarbamoyladenosine biosynthesis protein TsaE